MSELQMGRLFAAIGLAMNEAQSAIETDALRRYWEHFQARNADGDKNSPGAMTPKTQAVEIPHPDGTGTLRELRVPLVTLFHHSILELDQVRLRMKVSVSADQDSGDLRVDVGPLRADNKRTGDSETEDGRESGVHEIELTFKREEAPEGISRVTQEAVKLL
jgi:hypothetical protein